MRSRSKPGPFNPTKEVGRLDVRQTCLSTSRTRLGRSFCNQQKNGSPFSPNQTQNILIHQLLYPFTALVYYGESFIPFTGQI